MTSQRHPRVDLRVADDASTSIVRSSRLRVRSRRTAPTARRVAILPIAASTRHCQIDRSCSTGTEPSCCVHPHGTSTRAEDERCGPHRGVGQAADDPVSPQLVPAAQGGPRFPSRDFYDAPNRILQFISPGCSTVSRRDDRAHRIDCRVAAVLRRTGRHNYLRHPTSRAAHQKAMLPTITAKHFRQRRPLLCRRQSPSSGRARMLLSTEIPQSPDCPTVTTINATFAGVPSDNAHAILAGNAQRIYRFGESMTQGHRRRECCGCRSRKGRTVRSRQISPVTRSTRHSAA